MKNIFKVIVSKKAKNDLKKVPLYIAIKFQSWIDYIKHDGLIEVSKIKGYHDEPLKGDRIGQRSIRLNKSYRAIYEVLATGEIEFIEVQEITKHEY